LIAEGLLAGVRMLELCGLEIQRRMKHGWGIVNQKKGSSDYFPFVPQRNPLWLSERERRSNV